MMSDITLGQFFPGNSPLHRIDPRMKLILTILYIVVVFMADTIVSVLAVLLLSVLLIPVGNIPLRTVLKSMKPLLFIMIFTGLINLFWTKDGILVCSFWIIEIYSAGIVQAIFIIVRIAALLLGSTMLISYTTSPIALTDGMEQLLAPLSRIKIPVHDFAMMMTIALRFIPTLIEETDKIMSAQKARGADFSTGSIIKRAKALIPIFIPLFLSCIRRADELAVAMECRCYNGGKGKTRMNVLHYKALDFAALALVIVAGVLVFFVNKVPLPVFLLTK